MLLSYFDNKKNGPIILFIHGTASANDIWEDQYNFLSKLNFRIIGIDLRGHGRSKDPGGLCTLEDHIADLKETIDQIQIKEPFTIVGHSFGAVMAVIFAEKFPECVNKLLLAGFPAKIPGILLKYYQWLLGKPVEFLKKKVSLILRLPLKKKHKLAVCADLNIIRQIWKESIKWNFLEHMPKIRCPVYFSVGRFDYIALKGVIKKLHYALPNSRYKVFDWSAHTCMVDEPNEFNKWILSALDVPIMQQS